MNWLFIVKILGFKITNPKRFANAVATASNATIYTVPANTIGRVQTIIVTNTTGTDQTLEFWMVPSGDTALDENKAYFDDYTIPANDFMQVITDVPLSAGDFIQIKASAVTSITVQIFGEEIV